MACPRTAVMLTYKPDAHDEDYSGKRQGLSRVMDPGHSIHKTPHQEKGNSKEGASENDIPDPIMATYLLEEVGRDIASYTGSEGIEEDSSGVHGMVSVDIKHAQQSHSND